jgi:hypothetical protein
MTSPAAHPDVVRHIQQLTDDEELFALHHETVERLNRLYLSRLANLLRPTIQVFLRDELNGGSASHLIVRAAAYLVSKQTPWPVCYGVDSLHLNAAHGIGAHSLPQLPVPQALTDEVCEILRVLTQVATGLAPGHELWLDLGSGQ